MKEKYSYVCSDMNKELAKHESDPAKYSRTHTMWNAKAGQVKQPGRQGAGKGPLGMQTPARPGGCTVDWVSQCRTCMNDCFVENCIRTCSATCAKEITNGFSL